MEPTPSVPRSYALGHSAQELDRLSRQAEAFGPFTRALFQQAGIAPGSRVLDVGSGSGDVAFLAAEIVGPAGDVIGVDLAPAAVERANARAQSRGAANVRFLEGNPAEMTFAQPFDAIVGRLVLMYCPDPVDMLRKLARHLRPGGLIAFQEFDLANARSLPPAPAFEHALGWIRRTLATSGARLQLGLELYPLFVAAGLPGPSMRMDSMVGGGPDFTAYDVVADVVRSLLPAMEKFGIVTPAEVDVASLAERMRDEVVAGKGVVLSPALIGAWSRVSSTAK
jgi:SAM-dependent methyltransferase